MAKCVECSYYDEENKICGLDSWNDVNNPEQDIYCDNYEEVENENRPY